LCGLDIWGVTAATRRPYVESWPLPGIPTAPLRGLPRDIFTLSGGRSRIFNTIAHGARHAFAVSGAHYHFNWRREGQDNRVGHRRVGLQIGYSYIQASSQDKSGTYFHAPSRAMQYRTPPPYQGGLWRYHMSSGSRPRLRTREGSCAATCAVASDPISLLERAPALPRVLRLRTRPPRWESFSAATCPTVPYGPRATGIKKNLADLPMQLGLCISEASMHVSKMSDVRAIMSLQDVRKDNVFNACKTCGQIATMQLQYNADPVDHS
jgi:hypothetical protein